MKKILLLLFVIIGFVLVWIFTKRNTNNPDSINSFSLEVGTKAPELNLKTPDGKYIALSSLKGKMVLIDFWASWCVPCRKGNSKLIKTYLNYKNKNFIDASGFTIYSVSLDTKMEMWKRAIKQDDLSWENQVSDLGGWHSRATQLYHIDAIPDNYLINGKGIIIAKGLREGKLERILEQQLLKK